MRDVIDKLAMSGYAGYVWACFFGVWLVLLAMYFWSRYRLKKAQAQAVKLQDLN